MKHYSLFAWLSLIVGAASVTHGADDQQSWINTDSGCKVLAEHPVEDRTVSWTGACQNGYAEGAGTLTWSNGDVLQGTLRAGRAEGIVVERGSNGNRYEGEVHAGVANGKGKYYWANGDWYEGDFKEGHRDGVGTQYFGCSGRYQGTFHAGVIEGVGTFYLANGDRYEGAVHNGRMEGGGTLYLAHGNRYEGAFHEGAVEGLGVMYFANGNRYEGEFRSGLQDGLGTLIEANGTSYEGEFKADRPEGQAVVSYASGDKYQGVYVNGHVDGPGIYTKANGERDIAIFKERHGELEPVSRIGPALYKPCRDFCTASIAGCSGVVGTQQALSPSGQNMSSGLDRYAECANETSQCVESCREHNPTAGDVHGIIEVESLEPAGDAEGPDSVPAAQANKGSTTSAPTPQGGAEAPDFTMQQAGATTAMHARLEQQRRELSQLEQQVADQRQKAVAMQSAPSSAEAKLLNCPVVTGRPKK